MLRGGCILLLKGSRAQPLVSGFTLTWTHLEQRKDGDEG